MRQLHEEEQHEAALKQFIEQARQDSITDATRTFQAHMRMLKEDHEAWRARIKLDERITNWIIRIAAVTTILCIGASIVVKVLR